MDKPNTYRRVVKARNVALLATDLNADITETAPTSGKSLFDAICRASDAAKVDPQYAAVESAVKASLINKLTAR